MSTLCFKALFLIGYIVLLGQIEACSRVPSEQHGPKKAGDNGYRLIIGEEPIGYIPGKVYNCKVYNEIVNYLNITHLF